MKNGYFIRILFFLSLSFVPYNAVAITAISDTGGTTVPKGSASQTARTPDTGSFSVGTLSTKKKVIKIQSNHLNNAADGKENVLSSAPLPDTLSIRKSPPMHLVDSSGVPYPVQSDTTVRISEQTAVKTETSKPTLKIDGKRSDRALSGIPKPDTVSVSTVLPSPATLQDSTTMSDSSRPKAVTRKSRRNLFPFLSIFNRKHEAPSVPFRKNIAVQDKTATKKTYPRKTSVDSAHLPVTTTTTLHDTVRDDTVVQPLAATPRDTAKIDTSPVQNILNNYIPLTSQSKSVTEPKKEWRFFKAGKIISSLIVFLIGWLVLHYITMFVNLLSERWPQYRLVIKGFIPIVRIIGWTLLTGFIIIGIFKPPIASVVAFTASAGIAIGFASQDILRNIFGGIVILFDKPFKVGDKIQIDSFYGEVISIGIRTVRIVTMDDSTIAIPNSEIVSKSVSNANSGEPDCQVSAEFYFKPDLDLDCAQTLAIECAAISRYAYLNKPVTVVFKNEMQDGKSMIHMRLKAYVIDHRFEMAFITDMSRTVFREFRKAALIDAVNSIT